MKKPIALDQLSVGQSVPWNCYSEEGALLLRRGQVVESQRALVRLIEDGLFLQGDDSACVEEALIEEKPSALQYLFDARRILSSLYSSSLDGVVDFADRMDKIILAVQNSCDAQVLVSLSTIALVHDASYAIKHPIDVAILANVLSKALSLDSGASRTIVAAALTMNIGMVEVHDKIQTIPGPLNEKLLALVRAHPTASEQRLQRLGTTDAMWLTLVRQHHEHLDGSGYPARLSDGQIETGAQIVGLADKYCAMLARRADRPALKPPTAIRELYIKHGQTVDTTVAGTLIRVLGLYPVGTLVRLATAEIGVVTGPGEGPDTPEVHVIMARSGASLEVSSHRKTHLSKFAVEEVISIDKLNVPVRMASLWGKDAKVR
jgi:HD-GYP domain-containing protein (c-di-GMP phosphodiesterase class II)